MNLVAITDEAARTALPLHLITVGVDHRQEPRHRPNGVAFYQILYVSEGSGVYEGPSGHERIPAGTVIFTGKGVPSVYYGEGEGFRTCWVAFDGPGVEGLLSYLGVCGSLTARSEAVHAAILDLFDRAKDHASAVELSVLLYRLIVTFFEGVRGRERPSRLIAARDFVESEYRRDLSVAEIAGAVGVSESLLYRIFREGEHATPVEFVRSVRIRHAKELLIGSGELKIAEIAARVGFSDAAYFSKIFRADTGMTPRTYRSRYGQ